MAITDDETDGEEEEEEQLPAIRRSIITSDKLRSADTTDIKKLLWPNELVFTPEGQPAVYECLSARAFVNGYLTIMSFQKDSLTDKMDVHLHEMMDDWKTFRWPVGRAYQAVWLQHLEQGRAIWNDEVTMLKLRRAVVLHRIAPRPQPSATPDTNTPQARTRSPRHTAPSVSQLNQGTRLVPPTTRVCVPATPADLQVCSYCLQSVQKLCKHTELECKCTVLAKNGPGGSQAINPPPPSQRG